MKKYKIFVSGVQKELQAERQAVKESIAGDVLLSEYFDAFLFEAAPAKSRSAEIAYLEEVRLSRFSDTNKKEYFSDYRGRKNIFYKLKGNESVMEK